MFAAYDGDNEILGEGTVAEDLRCVLMEAVITAVRNTTRHSFLDRRTRMEASSSRLGARARNNGD